MLALGACGGDDDDITSDPPIITAGFGGTTGHSGSTSAGGAGQGGKGGTGGAGGSSGTSGQGGAGQGGSGASSGSSGEGGSAGTSAGAGSGGSDSGAAGDGGAGPGGSDAGTAGAAGDAGTAGNGAGPGGSDGGVAGTGGAAGDAGNGGGGSDAGTAGTGTGGAGQGGAGGGVSGSSGQPAGGAAGAAGGPGGAAGTGGTTAGGAGQAGTGGSGGTGAGVGGASGSSGQSAGGAAGTGGSAGAGGSGGSSSQSTIVAVVGRGLTPAQGLSYTPATGWTTAATLSLAASSGSLAPYKTGAAVMVRRASATSEEQNELFWTTWAPGKGFTTFTKVGNFGFAQDGPSLAGNGSAVEATFLGTDFKDYSTQLGDLGTFSPFAAFPGGQAGSQASSQRAIDLSSVGAATWAAYAGDDGGLYYASKAGPGSTWSFSAKAPASSLSPTIAPDVQAFDGGVTVAYVLSSNSRIALNTLTVPQNTWGAEETIGDSVITGATPALLRLAANDYLVVWHGLDNQGIYFARGGAGKWSAPKAILEPTSSPTSTPIVLAGVGSDRAEVLFTRDGILKHARYDGASFISSDVATTSSGVNVAATIVPAP